MHVICDIGVYGGLMSRPSYDAVDLAMVRQMETDDGLGNTENAGQEPFLDCRRF